MNLILNTVIVDPHWDLWSGRLEVSDDFHHVGNEGVRAKGRLREAILRKYLP